MMTPSSKVCFVAATASSGVTGLSLTRGTSSGNICLSQLFCCCRKDKGSKDKGSKDKVDRFKGIVSKTEGKQRKRGVIDKASISLKFGEHEKNGKYCKVILTVTEEKGSREKLELFLTDAQIEDLKEGMKLIPDVACMAKMLAADMKKKSNKNKIEMAKRNYNVLRKHVSLKKRMMKKYKAW